MNGLEQAFYIIGIIFMAVMLLIIAALAAAVFVIRNKVNEIHRHVDEKIHFISELANKGGELVGAVKKVKKAVRK